MKKYFVTYYWLLIHGNHSNRKAIECSDKKQLSEVAYDVCSYHGIRDVRLNICGRLSKGTTVISYDDYINNNWIDK